MELMKATGANLSQIFALCTDPSFTLEGIVETLRKGTPRVEVTDRDGVERRLFTVTESAVVAQVEGLLHDKELMIADGHHRYETALAYRDWRRAQEGCAGRPRAYEYMMMYLTNTEGEALTIYPTHRVLTNLALWDPERFVREVEGLFDVEDFSLGTEEESRRGFLEAMGQDLAGQVRIGMKCKAMEGYFLLTLRDQRIADAIFGKGVPPVLRKLDVKVLHTILLGHYLGIRPGEQGHDGKILYVKGVGNALQMLEEDLLHQAVFFLNPPTISLVSEVVRAGERMPQKSTFFYPKLLTGLVFRRIGEWQEEK